MAPLATLGFALPVKWRTMSNNAVEEPMRGTLEGARLGGNFWEQPDGSL
jgi:hypothetical protein